MPENDMGNVSRISLEISVTSDAVEKIQALAESTNALIATFNKTEAPFKKIEEHFDNLAKSAKEVDSVMRGMKDVSKVAADVQRAVGNVTQATKPTTQKTSSVNKRNRPQSQSEANAAFEQFKIGIESGTIERTADNFKELERLANARAKAISDEEAARIDEENTAKNATKEATREIEKQVVATEQTGTAAKKATPWWQKLGKQMARIALYRAVRMVLKEIAQAAREGVQNVAIFDERTNSALSKIMNTWKGVKNAFGSVLSELIIMFEPVITQIGDSLMDFGNNLAMVLAKLNGSDTYNKAIKANEDYADSLKEVSGQLLSFDKFETLNAGFTYFDKGSVSEDWNEQATRLEGFGKTIETFRDALQSLSDLLTGDWDSWVDDLTSGEGTLKALTGLALAGSLAFGLYSVAVNMVSSSFGKLLLVVGLFSVSFTLMKGILDSLNGPMKKVASLIATVASLMWTLFVVLQLTKHAITPWVAAAEITAGIGIAAAGIAAFNDTVPKYAIGGFPEDGLFYANHGELVGQFSNGKTAVANNQQIIAGISDGVYPAVYAAVVDAMKQNNGGNMAVYLDGKQVGRATAAPVHEELKRVGLVR